MATGAAQTKSIAPRTASPARSDDEAWVPLHPMHQRLVGELATAELQDSGLSRPQRIAALFYIGLAGWATVAVGAWGISALI